MAPVKCADIINEPGVFLQALRATQFPGSWDCPEKKKHVGSRTGFLST